jgi:hypothetical protein
MGLFLVWLFGLPWNSPAWVVFWLAVLAANVWIPLFGRMPSQRETRAQPALYLHRGIQALRQAAASGDNRLAPVVVSDVDVMSAARSEGPVVGRFQRVSALTNGVVGVVLSFILVLVAILMGWPPGSSIFALSLGYLWLVAFGAFLIEALGAMIISIQWLRPFEIIADMQGVTWREPALRFARRTVRAPWQDVRAFVTFQASKNRKPAADVDQIYLFETEKHAVAWKITPKTPSSMQEAHERFVRMANEHVPLRDITASLNRLLESPETRSYEYAIAVLSDPTPVPSSVRVALFPQTREPRFQQMYLIVSMILLTLLVVAGLLLQTGVIPPVPF